MVSATSPSREASRSWHAAPLEDIFRDLQATADGLTEAEVRRRLDRYGPNRLVAAPPVSAWRILLDQFRSVVVILLVVAAAVGLAVGDILEAAAVAVVLVINTALGFFTELGARRAMEALLRFQVPTASAVRDGASREIDAADLVPGDVIDVEAGRAVPADARLLTGIDLRTSEAALTGESMPVEKHAATELEPDTPLPERTTMLYKGTIVVAGRGRALVVATGMATELGRIGRLVSEIHEERTPLERRLDDLGRRLVWVALGVAAVVTALGVLQGVPVVLMVEAGIALAIAAVPEGLPAVATMTLAIGLRRMARQRALIRRLPAVEALGSTTVICTDKTGTLTAGQMMVTVVWAGGHEYTVTGSGFAPEGHLERDGRQVDPEEPVLYDALVTAALASEGDVSPSDEGWVAIGDPTDAALVVASRKLGIDRARLRDEQPRIGEVPFSSERKLAAVFHEAERGLDIHVKGAPGRIIELCDAVRLPSGDQPLDRAGRDRLAERNRKMAAQALRVLAVAWGRGRVAHESDLRNLTFLGLVGMRDAPAPGVQQTIDRLHEAGIRVVMLTGDQRLTAEAVGRELGVLQPGDEVMDGRDLQRLGDAGVRERLGRVAAFSRVSPEDKLKIVTAFQQRGEIVAMLGDGVNDAAALKRADVGVAMGMRGTDVAKEASAVVLQDDRFETVGLAVREGRVIYDNIRKFVFYLFSCNLAEIFVLLAASVAGLPLPLLPLQILWLNLVTDTFPAFALAFEPADPDVMRRMPRNPRAAILSAQFVREIAFYAGLISVSTLTAFLWGLSRGDVRAAASYSFMTLALAQIVHLGNARSQAAVVAPGPMFSNRYALGAVALSTGLQLVAMYYAPLAGVMRVEPLPLGEWAVIVPLAMVPGIVGQLVKLFRPAAEKEFPT